MSAEPPPEPENKAVSEPAAGAMPEKRPGAQAAGCISLQGFGRPSVYHAAIVIFLEFFAWGLLTTPMLTVSIAEQVLVYESKTEVLKHISPGPNV